MASIHILSDLHLEYADYLPSVETDIVILAGDIHIGTKGFSWARAQFPDSEIIYIAGNHEFYHSSYQILLKQFRIEAKKYQIHFLEKDEIILSGIRFLGCTLWTDYKCFAGLSQEKAMDIISYRLADHRFIKYINKDGQNINFSTQHALQLHSDSVFWLTEKLSKQSYTGKTVIITHHGPSLACKHEIYGHTDFAPAFYSDLPDLMAKSDLWVFGHTHSNLDITINNTRLLANQRGYPNEISNGFKADLRIIM